MPRQIPDCPCFEKITVGGVEHVLTPSPRRLDSFLSPAMARLGLSPWHDAGASPAIMPAINNWWPEPPCPVDRADEDGNDRWPTWSVHSTLESLLEEYPEESEEIREYFLWDARRSARADALAAVKTAIEIMGAARRQHVLQDVIADLERELPGFVVRAVNSHCHYCTSCSRAEHEVS